MRKFYWWIFIIIAVVVVGVGYRQTLIKTAHDVIYFSPCDTPIRYRINSVDPRFKLTKEEFAAYITDAIAIWNSPSGRQLFVADPQGLLSINLTFDNRQSLNDQITSLEGELKTKKNQIDPQIQEYNRLSADFKKRLDDLNTQIDYWNSKGGAPADEYEKLKNEQQALKEEAARLNVLAKSLNQSTDLYNTDVGKLNQTVDTFKEALSQRPEEGVYDGKNNRIDIYFNINKNELIHTLAHELGHALGLRHIQNSNAIMYPFTTEVISPSIEETLAIKELCKERTIFEGAEQVAQFYLKRIKTMQQ